ncbi:MAG: prepilin-type N-terminal cleavage/methylation domain-containing protein [Gammaproteobacteria bacterium]|nr:prepilin-type N-terminal cleavage/methylation domain-containing protein [Gammaproteobacteria bacterium]MDE2251216.1 prepilin-type N-terminal cleavage/methylation domain-containing protein [Gammaproteobacteria bacterium]
MDQRAAAPRIQRGVTLVELIIAITIVAIAATTILGTLANVASRSADAMVQQQAIAIGQAYLDEILQRWVVDPNGAPPNTGRGSWDLVDQYNGLIDTGARDQYNNPIAALGAYNVSVSVVASSALTGIGSAAARRIDVTVTRAPNVAVTLSGYRTSY